MEFLSYEALVGKITRQDASKFVWYGDKREYWFWKLSVRSALQKAAVGHWLDPTFNILEYPVDAFYRRSVNDTIPGDIEMITAYEKQYNSMTVDMQKASGIFKATLGPVLRVKAERELNNGQFPPSERVQRAMEVLEEEFGRHRMEVVYEIRQDFSRLPTAKTVKDIHDLIFLLEHWNAELLMVHRGSSKNDLELKLDLIGKIDRDSFIELHAALRRDPAGTYEDSKRLCEQYHHAAPKSGEQDDLTEREAFFSKQDGKQQWDPRRNSDDSGIRAFQKWTGKRDQRDDTRRSQFRDQYVRRDEKDERRPNSRGDYGERPGSRGLFAGHDNRPNSRGSESGQYDRPRSRGSGHGSSGGVDARSRTRGYGQSDYP